jgi:hydroxymethylpyrimidine pyrophosphatase-like HAD family hydrolase
MYNNAPLYVIGDDLNDIGMIKRFDGFCVANAKEEVKEHAIKEFESVASCIEHIMEM